MDVKRVPKHLTELNYILIYLRKFGSKKKIDGYQVLQNYDSQKYERLELKTKNH